MKISKKDALAWFSFFAQLPEEEPILPRQTELVYAVFSQIETAEEARQKALMAQIPGLKSLSGRTLYVGPDDAFSRGCRSCLMGNGLTTIRKTNRCNLNCPFCYNYGEMDAQLPIGEGFWEIGGSRFREEDVELLLSIYPKPTGVAYVYLEPFMEIDKYYGIIRRFHEAGVYQHMYTNGTLVTEDNARKLAEAGLDELRFNLGASNVSPKVVQNMAVSRRFLSHIGIETPMTPAFLDLFLAQKDTILATGAEFMNCAELHLNANNIENYAGENLYMTRLGYISPIWSRELTLHLMAQACEENWPMAVHDCSNMTKFARDLNLKAKEGGWFGQSGYGCEFDRYPFELFLPILSDPEFEFVEEEPLPEGYRPGDIVL